MIDLFTTNENCFQSVIEFLIKNLNEVYSNDIFFESPFSFLIVQRTINIMTKLINKNGFKEKFYEFCDNGFINIILSSGWRNNSPLMLEVVNFLNGINNEIQLPIRVVQIISFLIITNDVNILSLSLNLCKRFKNNEMKYLNDLLLNYFENEYKKEKVSHFYLNY